MRTAIAIKHATVAARDHVEVEIQQQVLRIRRVRNARRVELRPHEPVLLGAPPGEAHLVLDLELLQRLEDFKNERGARAVVVDTRAGLDGVEMRAEHDDVLRVAVERLGEDVLGGLLLDGLGLLEESRDGLASEQAVAQRPTVVLVDEAGGDEGVRVGRGERAARHLGRHVVVDDDVAGAGRRGGADAPRQRAAGGTGAALDEDDLACDIEVGVAVDGAAGVAGGAEDELGGDAFGGGGGRVGQAVDVVARVVDAELDGLDAVEQGGKVLDPGFGGGVVAGELGFDVVYRRRVTGKTEGLGAVLVGLGQGSDSGTDSYSVTPILSCDFVKRSEVFHQPAGRFSQVEAEMAAVDSLPVGCDAGSESLRSDPWFRGNCQRKPGKSRSGNDVGQDGPHDVESSAFKRRTRRHCAVASAYISMAGFQWGKLLSSASRRHLSAKRCCRGAVCLNSLGGWGIGQDRQVQAG